MAYENQEKCAGCGMSIPSQPEDADASEVLCDGCHEGDELTIPLPNGGSLRCGAGYDRKWGGCIRICDADGNEILYWDVAEWEEDGELVIGAVFSCAMSPIAELIQNRVLIDGVWQWNRKEVS